MYELDGRLSPGGTYQVRVQVKLLAGQPEAAANITMVRQLKSGQTEYQLADGIGSPQQRPVDGAGHRTVHVRSGYCGFDGLLH